MLLLFRPEEEQCHWEVGNILVPTCELQKSHKSKTIDRHEEVHYKINSPGYYGHRDYPNNT